MAINYFIGWAQADLEAELRAAQEDLAAGKATISAQGGDTRVGSAVERSAEERIRLLLRALSALDPEAYPPESINPITSTRASFD